MVEKIDFKGQHVATEYIAIQCYLQHSVSTLLQCDKAENFDKVVATKQINNFFATSTNVLDQLGRTG